MTRRIVTLIVDRWARLAAALAVAVTASVLITGTALASPICGRNSEPPTAYDYSFEQGVPGTDKIPGHMLVGWPTSWTKYRGAQVQGPGGADRHAEQNGVTFYRVDGIPPMGYRLVFTITCVDGARPPIA